MRIMIVEDEKLTREAITRDILGIGHHEVALAVDGIHALEIINEFQPDLILADIRMPRMDGLALLIFKLMNQLKLKPDELLAYHQGSISLAAFKIIGESLG